VAAEQKYVINSPTSGTPVLPIPSEQAILSGKWNKVPLIIGSVREENKLFDIAQANLTAAQYVSTIDSQYGANAPTVLAHYPLSNYPAPFYALAAVGTDSGFACHSYWLVNETASQVPTREEEFNDPTSPTLFGFQPPGIDMSNAHSAELAYLSNFTLGERPLTHTELRLGKQMDRYWAGFARNAHPNVPRQTHWPRVTTTNHPVLDSGRPVTRYPPPFFPPHTGAASGPPSSPQAKPPSPSRGDPVRSPRRRVFRQSGSRTDWPSIPARGDGAQTTGSTTSPRQGRTGARQRPLPARGRFHPWHAKIPA
jgi:Carboxylesterase family